MEFSLSSYNQYEFGADIFVLPSPDTSYDRKDMEHTCSPPSGSASTSTVSELRWPLLEVRKGIVLTVLLKKCHSLQVCFPPKNVAPG